MQVKNASAISGEAAGNAGLLIANPQGSPTRLCSGPTRGPTAPPDPPLLHIISIQIAADHNQIMGNSARYLNSATKRFALFTINFVNKSNQNLVNDK